MRTSDRDPRQLTLFDNPMDRRADPLDLMVVARDSRQALFARWGGDLGRAVVRHAPAARLAGRLQGA